jgi:hypothetical protein
MCAKPITYEVSTTVRMPTMTKESSVCVGVTVEQSLHTTSSPCLCFLLQLQEHIAAVVIVLEEVYIVDDQHKWFAALFGAAECDFLEFVQCCIRMLGKRRNTT